MVSGLPPSAGCQFVSKTKFDFDFHFDFEIEFGFAFYFGGGVGMARGFAKAFYNSAAWIKTSKAYAASVFFTCEKCGHPGYIVHHIVHLTPLNIGDPEITLAWSNLMYLCLECHNVIHGNEPQRVGVFDDSGNMIGLIDTGGPPGMAN